MLGRKIHDRDDASRCHIPPHAPFELVDLTTRAPIPVQRNTVRRGAFTVEVDEKVDTHVLRRILDALPSC